MLAERVVQWTEKWRAEGFAIGYAIGFAEGYAEAYAIALGMRLGEIALLQKQLQRRIGFLPESVLVRISQGPREHLEAWALSVLDAVSLDEVVELH